MSHHFDSPTGREDPRLNLCDIYIFPGSPGHTVMAMTVNAGTPAAFDFLEFNGRALTDDVMGVMLTLMTNTALTDGVRPPGDRVIDRFPYFGAPFSPAEQIGLEPLNPASQFVASGQRS